MKAILFGVLLLLLVAWLGFLLGIFWHKLSVKKCITLVWLLQFFMAIGSLVISLEMLGFFNWLGIVLGMIYLYGIIYLTNKNKNLFKKIIKYLNEIR